MTKEYSISTTLWYLAITYVTINFLSAAMWWPH